MRPTYIKSILILIEIEDVVFKPYIIKTMNRYPRAKIIIAFLSTRYYTLQVYIFKI